MARYLIHYQWMVLLRNNRILSPNQHHPLLKEDKAAIPAASDPAQGSKDATRQTSDWSLYRHYILSVGWFHFGILVSANMIDAVLDSYLCMFSSLSYSIESNMPLDIWLKQWSEAEEKRLKEHTAFYLGVYSAVYLLGLIMVIGGIWFMFMILVPMSGRALHKDLLNTIVHAKQELHETVDVGVTLNRFAQDIQHVDRDLPSATMRALHATFWLSCFRDPGLH